MIKIVKISQSMGDDDELEKLVRKSRSEVMAKPRNVDYKLSEYVHHKVIESTRATLRSLVSSHVSGGAITKPSLTLAQCIQQHVDSTSSNQTTLGLSVKLHHKHGSSELVKTLNKHGITSSYDKVLRFRKSVAKFVSDNQSDYHKKLGLSTEIGPIFSWADNYDLYIASPNGIKATHDVVMEFTQHTAGIIETGNIGVMQLTIPRSTEETRAILSATDPPGYTVGAPKLNPPLLQTKALSAEESQLQSAAVRFSQQRDAAWLSQVHQNDKPVEWAGFNAKQDPVMEATRQRHWWCSDLWSTRHLTTPTPLWQRSCSSKDSECIWYAVHPCLSRPQQNDPQRWTGLILHPCMMHTLMSFLGCIGTLMKSSGVEVLMSAAFGCITSIINGKAWTNALRAYRLIIAVLLQSFYSN